MLKTDLHLHSSEDPQDHRLINYDSKELIRRTAKLNFKVLALTHHCNVFYNKELVNYAKRYGIFLVQGAEAEIEGKEVLLYNIDNKTLKKIKTFSDLEREKREGIFVIAPHPFFKKPTCLGKKLFKYKHIFDAVEYSHFYTRFFNKANKKAVAFARESHKPLVGSSDAHNLWQLGYTYSLLDAEQNLDSIFEAIRENKIKIVSKPLPYLRYFNLAGRTVFFYFLKRCKLV